MSRLGYPHRGLWTVLLVLCCPSPLLAQQDNSLLSVIRGDLLEWSPGEFSVRSADSSVQRCRYDDKTYLEREKQKVASTGMAIGQQVEVIADRGASGGACYARTVRVTRDDEGRRAALAAARLQALRVTRSPILDSIFPRQAATSASLHPNMRVFIRAGKNLDDEIEAYQVVWGEILTPNP